MIYGIQGVCTVLGTETKKIDGRQVTYYVLTPIHQTNARFFVPTQNPSALAKIRKLISREELELLLHSETLRQSIWIDDENKRKTVYREWLASGDRTKLLQLVYTLYQRKKALLETGKSLHQCDLSFLSDAQKLLNDEFSCVLEIPLPEVGNYLANIFEK